MAKTVADVARMLEAIAGADRRDAATAAAPVPKYGASLGGGIKGLRVGIADSHFFNGVQAETEAAVRGAIALLEKLGAVLVDVTVRNAALSGPASWVILMSEAAAFHEKRLKHNPELFDPLVRERLEIATFNSAIDYIKALRVRTVLMEEMRRIFRTCDVLALPAGNAAPLLEAEIVGTDAPSGAPSPPRPDSWTIANMTGIPALVLPCGFTGGAAPLPLGIQFWARPFNEAALFRAGHAYQSATDWHTRKPPLMG
jgi:aspartyl-tRNA(Asn)/glutamyl-tRNA(Gln) amidotransferase subunit A